MQAKVIVVNAALSVLGKASRVPQVQQLMEAARTTGQLNTYTWGCAFQALADAGRPDAAFNLFDKACQQVSTQRIRSGTSMECCPCAGGCGVVLDANGVGVWWLRCCCLSAKRL